MATPGQHIFYAGLKGQDIDLAPVQQSWSTISDGRLEDYKKSIPHQWIAGTALDDAVSLIQGVRDNIAAAVAEVGRVLK